MSKLKFDRDEIRIFNNIRREKSKISAILDGLDAYDKPHFRATVTGEVCGELCGKLYDEILKSAEQYRNSRALASRQNVDFKSIHQIVSDLLRLPSEEHEDVGLWLQWMERQLGRELYGDPEGLKLWKAYNRRLIKAYLKSKKTT